MNTHKISKYGIIVYWFHLTNRYSKLEKVDTSKKSIIKCELRTKWDFLLLQSVCRNWTKIKYRKKERKIVECNSRMGFFVSELLYLRDSPFMWKLYSLLFQGENDKKNMSSTFGWEMNENRKKLFTFEIVWNVKKFKLRTRKHFGNFSFGDNRENILGRFGMWIKFFKCHLGFFTKLGWKIFRKRMLTICSKFFKADLNFCNWFEILPLKHNKTFLNVLNF